MYYYKKKGSLTRVIYIGLSFSRDVRTIILEAISSKTAMIFQSGLNHPGHVFGSGGEEGHCRWGLEKPVLKGSTAERKKSMGCTGRPIRGAWCPSNKGRAQQRNRN